MITSQNNYLNDKMRNLTPYEPETADCRIRLDANESFMVLPDYIRESMADAILKLDFNRYPDPTAKETCVLYSQLIDVDPELLVAGNGSDELISLILSSFTQKGDKVMLVSPDFSMYSFYAHQYELQMCQYDKGMDFRVDVNVLIRAINAEAPRIVILSNPCSPTGRGITRSTMTKILGACTEPIFVIDEAYMDFWNESMLPDVAERENVVILKTCSKSIGIAALRLGFAYSNPEFINVLRSVKSPYNVNAATQAMAACVFREKRYLNKCIASIRASIESLVKGLKYVEAVYPDVLTVFPTVTNFVFLRCKNPTVHEKLIEHGILVRKMGRYLRVTCGNEAENKEFINTIAAILQNIRLAEKSAQ